MSQRKSLKQVAINLKFPKIQDLPYDYDKWLNYHEVNELVKYNYNDVNITHALMIYLAPEINLRYKLSQLYNVDVLNKARSGIADVMLNKFYSEYTGLHLGDFKNSRTYRTNGFSLSECIDDKISFDKYSDVRVTLKKAKSGKSKKTFHLIKADTTMHWVLDYFRELYVYTTGDVSYRITFNDYISFDIMSGGLHSIDEPNELVETDTHYIVDNDATSYYPSIMVNGGIHPAHLISDKFLEIVKFLRDDRVVAKANGEMTRAEALKITINSMFGKLGFEYYWLFDLKALLSVTMSGQFYLLSLIEDYIHNDIKVISANTDGIIINPAYTQKELVKQLGDTWEKRYKFGLEATYYSKYVRRDVNSYIAVYKGIDKIKYKGCFLYDVDITKGYNMPIVAKALYEYYVNNVNVRDTIMNHANIYDFCKTQNSNKKYQNETHAVVDGKLKITVVQKDIRYYISNTGVTLLKRDKLTNKLTNLCKSQYATIFNDYIDSDNYNINYSYYILEANKIINSITAGISGNNKRKLKKALHQIKLNF